MEAAIYFFLNFILSPRHRGISISKENKRSSSVMSGLLDVFLVLFFTFCDCLLKMEDFQSTVLIVSFCLFHCFT